MAAAGMMIPDGGSSVQDTRPLDIHAVAPGTFRVHATLTSLAALSVHRCREFGEDEIEPGHNPSEELRRDILNLLFDLKGRHQACLALRGHLHLVWKRTSRSKERGTLHQ